MITLSMTTCLILILPHSISNIKVIVESTTKVAPIASFADAGLHPVIVENIRLCGYKVPTPIQAYGIPAILAGRDLMAVAQTGISHIGTNILYIFSLLMKYFRIGKDCRVSYPHSLQTDGEGEEACCSTSKSWRGL